ncbi:MAG: cytochrome c biogenesis protein CcdA [Dehalococcoidia bacterium]
MTAASDATSGAGRQGWLREGYPRSFIIGTTFAVAWSPCIGPILGAVLTMAATSGTALQGGLLLVAYSLGLGVWFLAFGAFFGWLAPRMRRVQRYMPWVLMVAGALFIVVGAMMFLGEFGQLNQRFQSFGFFFGRTSEAEEQLSSGTSGALGPAVAFVGGVVSFLSPCVLPLVPVYLANLAGVAAIEADGGSGERRRLMLHSAAFVVGFTIVFASVGASAGLAGDLVQEQLGLLARIGGMVLVVFGLHMSGLIHLPYLDRTYQLPAGGRS